MLYSRHQGQGEPLVLIHGLFGSLENLGALAKLLSQHFTVYSVDLPNHGRSPHTADMSLQSMAAAVGEWMDGQGLSSAHFLGHSLGGKTAMEFALRHPARVRKLIVVDIAPVGYPPHHNDVFAGLLNIDPDSLGSRQEADHLLLPHVPELAVRSFLLKNLVKEESGFHWRMNLPVIHRCYSQLISANSGELSFAGDVLFFKGGNSDYIGESQRDAILDKFPNAQLKVIANTGHWLHAEKPELVATLSLKFLQDL